LLLLGRQPHTAALVAPARANSTAAHPKVHLTLAPLSQRLPEALAQLHQRSDALAVPAADRAAFEADYLPRLRQHLEITSSDGSIALAEETPPRLELVVAWEGLRADLTWRWRYAGEAGEGGATFPLTGGARALAVRRPA